MSDTTTENKAPAEAKDLEVARDEKCIPIARWILNDIARLMIPEDANVMIDYNPIVLAMLKRALEADLNIATEVSYIPQLILGVLGGLNKTVQECAFVPIDDVRYGRIARKILSIVATADIRMGNVTPEQVATDFIPVKEQLNALFDAEKLSYLEIKYIMDNIFESFTSVNNMFQKNLENSSARAEAKLFGIESMSDLTVGRLNEVLISSPEAPEATPA